jgi:hypothetical protein
LQLFVGMGAIAGGLPMLQHPEGSPNGLSIEALANTPFTNYFIPGILLFSVIGMGSLIASYFSLKFKKDAGLLGVIFGSALIIWILFQLYFLGFASWLQALYIVLGIVELVFAFLIIRRN